jgi:predicted ATP-grasp superfamily ATP-dependent carboligase
MQPPDTELSPGMRPGQPTSTEASGGRPGGPVLGPRLILVGGSVRAAAESARRAGFQVTAVDGFGDRETLAAAESWHPLDAVRETLRQRCRPPRLPRDAELVIAGGLRGDLEWLRGLGLPFRGVDPEQFSQAGRLECLREVARRAGVGFPPTQAIGANAASTRGFAREGRDCEATRWLVKQHDSCGGLGVTWFARTDPLPEQGLLQRHLPGKAYGATYVSDGRGAVWVGLSRLLTRAIDGRPFVYAGCLGPLTPCAAVADSLRRLGAAMVAVTGITGPLNADVIIDGETVSLLEINPRYSASMEVVEASFRAAVDPASSFFDPADRWRSRLPGSPEVTASAKVLPLFLKRVLYAGSPGRLSPDDFPWRREDTQWHWTDVPSRPIEIAAGEPAATVIARLDRISLRRGFRILLPLHPGEGPSIVTGTP